VLCSFLLTTDLAVPIYAIVVINFSDLRHDLGGLVMIRIIHVSGLEINLFDLVEGVSLATYISALVNSFITAMGSVS